ncbi:hypothetical protein EOL73_00560 [Candidatus Saccharibacteria bacterium]|nr:hypothetical protein [Candidatus Saccharibacteria bacterium]NCU40234.1 hypothetical protein [Candidatus Saccharibacteria bacterium]
MNNYTYKLVFNPEKDAWNWYNGCQKTGFGVDWKQRIDSDVADKLSKAKPDEAYEFLDKYLKQKYQEDSETIRLGLEFINKRFEEHFELACQKLIEITGRPLYRDDFTIYLTTFPRGPYDFQSGSLWLPILWINPIANFMHEILHFQTIYYWRNNPKSAMNKMSKEDFEVLKESLTFVLDQSLVPPLEKPDLGYTDHHKLRVKLYERWLEDKNFDDLIEFGTNICHK